MFCGGKDELARIALFEFMMGNNEETQIAGFNKILSLLGVRTELSITENGRYIWKHCSYDDQYRAEKLFDVITQFLTREMIQEMIDQERLIHLLTQYREVIDDTTRKINCQFQTS